MQEKNLDIITNEWKNCPNCMQLHDELLTYYQKIQELEEQIKKNELRYQTKRREERNSKRAQVETEKGNTDLYKNSLQRWKTKFHQKDTEGDELRNRLNYFREQYFALRDDGIMPNQDPVKPDELIDDLAKHHRCMQRGS